MQDRRDQKEKRETDENQAAAAANTQRDSARQ